MGVHPGRALGAPPYPSRLSLDQPVIHEDLRQAVGTGEQGLQAAEGRHSIRGT